MAGERDQIIIPECVVLLPLYAVNTKNIKITGPELAGLQRIFLMRVIGRNRNGVMKKQVHRRSTVQTQGLPAQINSFRQWSIKAKAQRKGAGDNLSGQRYSAEIKKKNASGKQNQS